MISWIYCFIISLPRTKAVFESSSFPIASNGATSSKEEKLIVSPIGTSGTYPSYGLTLLAELFRRTLALSVYSLRPPG